ncbi:MAG TPA: hypothetical protein VIU61_19120 [Kofleriaceae bacterium]
MSDAPSETPRDEVDVTLIRWMLSLTADERLAVLQGFVDSVEAMRPGPESDNDPRP